MIAAIAQGQSGSRSKYASATVGAVLPTPVLTAVAGASTYHLWAWNKADGWQMLDEALTLTRYTHVDRAAGRI